MRQICFTTKRNYTTLKPYIISSFSFFRFTTKRNYTTLKLEKQFRELFHGFTTKRNYTTLKLFKLYFKIKFSFTTKRNYTTLKRGCCLYSRGQWFYYQKKLHYSQTSRCRSGRNGYSFTTKRNYTTLKPQIHGAKSTVLLPNRVISVDISAKTAQIRINDKCFFTFKKIRRSMFYGQYSIFF